jgi:hypothetical protein
MNDRRPGRRPRSGRRAGTHNQRPWLWVPASAGTTRVGFVGFVSPKCAATALALLLTMSNSLPRSRGGFAPGVLHRCFTHPESRGWAERRETFGCSAEHPWGVHITRHARRLARRLASHNAGRSPLGAPPWRFFTRGRASLTGIGAGSVTASSSHPGRSAWRAGSRASRGERLRSHPPQDATPRSAFRIVSRTRPQ